MNIIDIVLIIPIAWFAYQGFRKGLIIEVAGLLALILGIYAGIHFSGYAADFLVRTFDMNERYVPVTAFAVTFLVVVILVIALGKILEKLVDIVALGFLNKFTGSLFGIMKGVVILSVILLVINKFDARIISPDKKEGSILYGPVEALAPFLWDRLNRMELPGGGASDRNTTGTPAAI